MKKHIIFARKFIEENIQDTGRMAVAVMTERFNQILVIRETLPELMLDWGRNVAHASVNNEKLNSWKDTMAELYKVKDAFEKAYVSNGEQDMVCIITLVLPLNTYRAQYRDIRHFLCEARERGQHMGKGKMTYLIIVGGHHIEQTDFFGREVINQVDRFYSDIPEGDFKAVGPYELLKLKDRGAYPASIPTIVNLIDDEVSYG